MNPKIAKWIPDRKTLMGGLWGVVAFGIQVGLQQFWGIEVPVIYQPLIPLAVAKVASYITVPAFSDIVNRINDTLAQVAGYVPDTSPKATLVRSLPAAPVLPPKPADLVPLLKAA